MFNIKNGAKMKVSTYNEGGGVWSINAKTTKQMVCELRGMSSVLSKLKMLYTTSHSVRIIPTENFNYQIDVIIRDGGPTETSVRIINSKTEPVHQEFAATTISAKNFSATIDVQCGGSWTVVDTDSTSSLIIESNGSSINISSPYGEDITGRVINIADSTGEVHTITI